MIRALIYANEEFIWKKFGEMGYFGLNQPEEYGGLELDLFYTVLILLKFVNGN